MRYTYVNSPLGPMLLTGKDALCGCYFVGQRYQPEIAADWREDAALPVFRQAAEQLAGYFAGDLWHFDLPLDLSAGTAFQQRVWHAIAGIAAGTTLSYRQLAVLVEAPSASRAAGSATGRNPLSIVIPCHRIVGSDGSLTGYAGGLARKTALLTLEGYLPGHAPNK